MSFPSARAIYRVLPGGTRPADVANLVDAIRALYDDGEGVDTTDTVESLSHLDQAPLVTSALPLTRATDEYGPAMHPILVPVAPGTDYEQARRDLEERIVDPVPDPVAVILQTSGSTTGRGRLVGISRLALKASALATSAFLGGNGRWILALPAHHVAGFQVLVRSVLAGHRPIIVDTTKGFDPHALARAATRATKDGVPGYVSLVPTQVQRIINSGEDVIAPLRALRAILVGGSAIRTELLESARSLGLPLVTTYGMTETCGGCIYNGLPLPGTHVATIDGRVWLAGTTLMIGYLDEPGAEDFVVAGRRRWLRTRDLGHMVGPRLVVEGRADDVIITGGIKVQADVVEDTIREIPGIADVAVVGVPDPEWGQAVAAVFVPDPEADQALFQAMRERRAHTLETEPDKEETPESSPIEIESPRAMDAPLSPLDAAMAAMAARIRGEDVDVVKVAQTGRLPASIYRSLQEHEADEETRAAAEEPEAPDMPETPDESGEDTDGGEENQPESPTPTSEVGTLEATADDRDIAYTIRSYVSRELDSAHAPRIIVMADQLPMRGIGKLDRRRVETLVRREVDAGHAWVR